MSELVASMGLEVILSLPGRRGKARVAIVTITPRELAQAKQIFKASENIVGTSYQLQAKVDIQNPDVVVTRAADRTNMGAMEVVGNLVEEWRPDYIILAGTAGAVPGREPQAQLGDVVIADYVEYVEFFKLAKGKFLRRAFPIDHPSLHLRANFAEPLIGDTSWHPLITERRPSGAADSKPRILIGNVAAGEKIFGDVKNPFQKHVVKVFDKAIALEMESAGVARAVCRARSDPMYNPQYITIRGISDLISDRKNDKTRGNWTDYAACVALAFSHKLVENLLAVQKT